MKIAVWHNLPSGGGKRALYEHVRGLLQRGHTIEVWTPETGNRSYLPLSELAPEHVMPFKPMLRKRDDPVSDALFSYRRVRTDIARMNQACLQAAQEINAGGFDVLFGNSCHLYYTSSISQHVRAPKVLYLGEPNRLLYEARPRLPWVGRMREPGQRPSARTIAENLEDLARLRKARILADYEVTNAAAYDRILVNSHFTRENVLQAYNLNATVCYLGIDTAKFKNLQQDRENFVIGIGAVQAQKNIEFVVRALGAITARRPKLVWVGNMVAEEYRDYLEKLARSLEVSLEIKVMVTDAEVVELLNRAAMMVYAPRLEPFGYAPLEANACGLPVVAVAEGGLRETIVDGVNGLLAEGEPQKMAAAIERLLLNPGLARQIGENASRLVRERWTLDAATDRLEQHLQQAVDAAASTAP